jgi:hypothetical protein
MIHIMWFGTTTGKHNLQVWRLSIWSLKWWGGGKVKFSKLYGCLKYLEIFLTSKCCPLVIRIGSLIFLTLGPRPNFLVFGILKGKKNVVFLCLSFALLLFSLFHVVVPPEASGPKPQQSQTGQPTVSALTRPREGAGRRKHCGGGSNGGDVFVLFFFVTLLDAIPICKPFVFLLQTSVPKLGRVPSLTQSIHMCGISKSHFSLLVIHHIHQSLTFLFPRMQLSPLLFVTAFTTTVFSSKPFPCTEPQLRQNPKN